MRIKTKRNVSISLLAAGFIITIGSFYMFACSALQPNYVTPPAVTPTTQPGVPITTTNAPVVAVLTPTPVQTEIVGGVQAASGIASAIPVYGVGIGLGLSLLGNLLGGIWGVKKSNTVDTLTGLATDLVNAFHGASAASPTGNVNTAEPVAAAAIVPALSALATAVGSSDAIHTTIAALGPAPATPAAPATTKAA